MPREVTQVPEPREAKVMKISYTQFSSSLETHFTCSETSRICLQSAATDVTSTHSGLYLMWFLYCAPAATTTTPSPTLAWDKDTLQQCKLVKNDLSVRKCPNCPGTGCDGFRSVHRKFATTAQAEALKAVLDSVDFALVDPNRVHTSDRFVMGLDDFVARSCPRSEKRIKMKIYRIALGVGIIFPEGDLCRIDAYFVGLWLGDGSVGRPVITSSDPEIATYLANLVARMNASGGVQVRLTSRLIQRAGTLNRSGLRQNQDLYQHAIVVSGSGRNPIVLGLRELGLLDNKGGIPAAIMSGTKETKLRCLAGLIDSDGCYDLRHKIYALSQWTEDHRQIILDAKHLAKSVGIPVTGWTTVSSRSHLEHC